MYIIICGATGTGKSAAALAAARLVGGEIVSCDSMQVYRGMDIGTSKVPAEMRSGIPHHLIDIINPDEPFTAAQFKRLAEPLITDIISRKKIPILCGGTGLYIDALIKGIFEGAGNKEGVREKLNATLDEKGLEYMAGLLSEKDPEEAAVTDLKNPRRVIRALEIIETEKMKASVVRKKASLTAFKVERAMFVLSRGRENLNRALDARVDAMFAAGLEDEVRSLMNNGLKTGSTAMQAIGYKETALYIEGKLTLDEAVQSIKSATRQYAKRQETWFKRYKEAEVIDMDKNTVEQAVGIICRAAGVS